jgi:hypothetical protein
LAKIITSDVLVIGGGAAGIAAACAAASSGLKVALIERHSYLGGKATASVVGTLCGLYLRNKNSEAQFVCNGFSKSLALQLQELSNTLPQSNADGLHYLPYHPFKFKILADRLLQKSGVELFLHSTLTSCNHTATEIESVSVLVFDEEITFVSKQYIDCSGEAILANKAGIKMCSDDTYQAAAHVFEVHNIAATTEHALGFIMLREISKAIEQGKLSSAFQRTSIVPGSLQQNKVLIKVGLPLPISLTLNSVTQIEVEARKLVDELFEFLHTSVSAFTSAILGEVAAESGIRTGKRPIGNYVLNEPDVLTCRKFDTGIANGSWPVEFWEPSKKVHMSYFAEDDFYQIPAECLSANEVSNLYFAGRIISADSIAIASARVIGTCLQTGYAAGKLAVAKIHNTPVELAIKQIRLDQLV